MLLAETVIHLCAMAESREGAKERGSRVRTNKDSRKDSWQRGTEGQAWPLSQPPDRALVGLGQGGKGSGSCMPMMQ